MPNRHVTSSGWGYRTERLEGRWFLDAPALSGLDVDAEPDADDEPLAVAALPPAVVQALRARFPDLRVLEAESSVEDGARVYDLTAASHGREFEASVAPDGTILETEGWPATEAPPVGILEPLADPEPETEDSAPGPAALVAESTVPEAVVPESTVPEAVSATVLDDTEAVAARAPAGDPAPSTAPDAADTRGGVELLGIGTADDGDDGDVAVAPSQVPASVLAALRALFPGARVIEAEAGSDDGEPEIGVLARANGRVVDVAFAPEGRVLEVQQVLTVAELPEAVLNWARRNFPGAALDEIAAADADGATVYEIRITPPDGAAVEATLRLPGAPFDLTGGQEGDQLLQPPRDDGNSTADGRTSEGSAPLVSVVGQDAGGESPVAEQDPVPAVERAADSPTDRMAADAGAHPAPADRATPPPEPMPAEDRRGRAAAAVAWLPAMAGVPDERLLSAAAALLERRLADLLRKVTAPTRDDPRGPDVAGGVRIPAALLAVAAAHLVLQEWRERERRGATAASFGASPNGTTWTRGSGIWSHW